MPPKKSKKRKPRKKQYRRNNSKDNAITEASVQSETVAETVATENPGSNNTKGENMNKATNAQNTLRFLTVIQKSARLLQSKNAGCNFLSVFEKILALADGDCNKMKAICETADVLLEDLEEYTVDEISSLQDKLKRIIFPKELRKFVVDSEAVQESIFNVIGEGAFGLVTLGKLNKPDGSSVKVVIKEAKRTEHEYMIQEEARIMSRFDHKNVVKLLAFVKEDPARIVLEYMELKDISSALRMRQFTFQDLLNFVLDVASGMEYIAGKNYVYRDLACRNVFINRELQCKIGDLGLCKYVIDSGGVYKETELAPYMGHNLAPETRRTANFTIQSDVWGMGLLIWELYFRASNEPARDIFFLVPVPVAYRIPQILREFVITGMLPQPRRCPPELYKYSTDILLSNNPERRPSFTAIRKKICYLKNIYPK